VIAWNPRDPSLVADVQETSAWRTLISSLPAVRSCQDHRAQSGPEPVLSARSRTYPACQGAHLSCRPTLALRMPSDHACPGQDRPCFSADGRRVHHDRLILYRVFGSVACAARGLSSCRRHRHGSGRASLVSSARSIASKQPDCRMTKGERGRPSLPHRGRRRAAVRPFESDRRRRHARADGRTFHPSCGGGSWQATARTMPRSGPCCVPPDPDGAGAYRPGLQPHGDRPGRLGIALLRIEQFRTSF